MTGSSSKESKSAKKPRAKKALTSITGEGFSHAAVANDASFVAVAGSGQLEGKFQPHVTIHRTEGNHSFPLPAKPTALAVLPDHRLLVAFGDGWPQERSSHPSVWSAPGAGLALYSLDGTELARHQNAGCVGHAKLVLGADGRHFALATTGTENHGERYLRTTIWLGALDALDAVRSVEIGSGFDDLAIDGEGAVVVEAMGETRSFDLRSGAPRAFTGIVALRGHLDRVRVLRGEQLVFELPVNVTQRCALLDDTRLVTVANAVKKRMGVAGEQSVGWPDPEPLLRLDHLAVWDIEHKKLIRALARSPGTLVGHTPSVASGKHVAVLTAANKHKVELFDL